MLFLFAIKLTLKIKIMNIYVGNLDYKVNEEDLRNLFEEFGNISSVKIIIDKYSGRSKGFGFVEMEEGGKNAIQELNGKTFKNREIIVNEARAKRNFNG